MMNINDISTLYGGVVAVYISYAVDFDFAGESDRIHLTKPEPPYQHSNKSKFDYLLL